MIKALTLAVLFALASQAKAEERFIADFADSPGLNIGTMNLEAGATFTIAWGMKALFDITPEGRKMDFIPAIAIPVVTIFWHIPMYRNGGEELAESVAQDVFESGGAILAVTLPI